MTDTSKPAEATPTVTPAPEAPVTTPAPITNPAPQQESEEVSKLREENFDLRFKNEIGDMSKTYTRAAEFTDKIREYAKSHNMSPTDAALIVLHQNNALQTQPAASATQPSHGGGFGGSMDNPPPSDQKDPEPGTPEATAFYAKRFQELEAKGEIRLA